MVEREVLVPIEGNIQIEQLALKCVQEVCPIEHGPGFYRACEAESGQRTGGFADIPLDGVQAITAIGHMGSADIFASG